jgi:hypothetical protein
MTSERPVPEGVDPTKPSVARVYDIFLGGKDNFAVDRMVAQKALEITRTLHTLAGPIERSSAASCGISSRRWASGSSSTSARVCPHQGNVHEIAERYAPDVQVIYVDYDPMVLAHAVVLLDNAKTATVIQADISSRKDPQPPDVTSRIDFSKPIGLLLFAILHHLPARRGPGRRRRALANRSCPAATSRYHTSATRTRIRHGVAKARQVEKIFNETLGTVRWRDHDEILEYFGDTECWSPAGAARGVASDADDEPVGQTDTYHTFRGRRIPVSRNTLNGGGLAMQGPRQLPTGLAKCKIGDADRRARLVCRKSRTTSPLRDDRLRALRGCSGHRITPPLGNQARLLRRAFCLSGLVERDLVRSPMIGPAARHGLWRVMRTSGPLVPTLPGPEVRLRRRLRCRQQRTCTAVRLGTPPGPVLFTPDTVAAVRPAGSGDDGVHTRVPGHLDNVPGTSLDGPCTATDPV